MNGGDSTAYNAFGILQKAEVDSYFQLSDTIKYFGDIAPQDSAFTSDDGFNVIIVLYNQHNTITYLQLYKCCSDYIGHYLLLSYNRFE